MATKRTLLEKHKLFHRINGDKELKDSACRIAGFLMWRLNCERESCWPGRQKIADALGMSLRTVGDGLRSLKDRGWITWREQKKEDGSHTSSLYTFVWDRADEDKSSYVHVDENHPQDPDAIERAGKSCQGGMAEVARINKGRVTREDLPSLSTAAPTKEKAADRAKPSPSPSPSAEKPAPIEGSPDWWKDRFWKETAMAFKARFYPTISGGEFRKRAGSVLKREQWDYHTVDRALEKALASEPAMDAFEYVTGILRNKTGRAGQGIDPFDPKKRIDYSEPLRDKYLM